MNQTICEAIKKMKILSFTYNGHERTVEPHAHGVTTAGNECLRCYQVAGGSSSGKVPDWKLMTADKMSDLQMSQNGFSKPRDGYNKGDKGMSTICCEL